MAKIFNGAKFIKAPYYSKNYSLNDPLPIFRKEFIVNEDIKTAKITVQSPGFAIYYINGNVITNDLFISPLSNYNKILWYNTYDVSKLIKKGKNVISVIAGNGFYNESFKTTWEYEKSPWRDAPKFILSIKINGVVSLVSDESWRVSKDISPITYSHLRSGEHFDSTKDNESWKRVGYDDSSFSNVVAETPANNVKFLKTNCPPVKEVETLKPVNILKNSKGYVIDFGKNISGYAKITVSEKRGSVITMRYAEEINEENLPKYSYLFYEGHKLDNDFLNDKGFTRFYPESPFQVDKLITSGGVDEYKPYFTYHGFRYLHIEGLTKQPSVNDFTAYFIHNNLKKQANFTSGNKLLNFIYNAGINSTKSNLFWSLTDCPTREKFGWTNDAASSCEQVLINFDSYRFFEKWYHDLKVDMRKDGSLPGIIPSNGWGDDWGPVCDNLLFELPYKTYLYTGNSKMLIGAIPYLKRYIKFLSAKKKTNHEFILGDWLGYDSSPLTPKQFVRDFYLIKAMRITVIACNLKGENTKNLQEKLSKIENEFISTYVNADGSSKVNSQTALSMLIAFNLCPNKLTICKQLVNRVILDGYNLTCGMVGVQYLYNALTESGRPDLAYKIITNSEPGYKTWFNLGATTLWECWNGFEHGSHNHQMFSGVIAWFYKSLLGINVTFDNPAYKVVELKPQVIKDLKWVKGYVKTPYGKIYASYKYNRGNFIYKINIPKGVTAIYNGKTLTNGNYEFIISEKEILY